MSVQQLKQSQIKEYKLALDSIALYRKLLEDEVINKLYILLDTLDASEIDIHKVSRCYNDFYYALVSSKHTTCLKDYIIQKIIFDENPFSIACETNLLDTDQKRLLHSAANDLFYLELISNFSSSAVKQYIVENTTLEEFVENSINRLSSWECETGKDFKKESYYPGIESIKNIFKSNSNWDEFIHLLSEFYSKQGCGEFARHKAFLWEKGNNSSYLRGIDNSDPITLSSLIGYDSERSEVIENTIQFLNGFPANNILLYGDRGTGKSSTVKAILNEYHSQGLRLIEVQKNHLIDFPEIVRSLKGRKHKFIIFVDDLAFEDNEENYTALKAVLEGGIECKPSNVLIYATSNRRHLIKEKFSDRAGLISSNTEDEVRAADSIQEKLSLSDRFGITVIFSSPDKYKYLEIVEGIAAKRGLKVDKDYLHKEALKWELWYNGRSPRTARQFVDWLEGKTKGV